MKGVKIKKKPQKKNPQTCTIFAHHTLLEIFEQKNLGFEERGKKSKEGYRDSISLQVGCGRLPQVCIRSRLHSSWRIFEPRFVQDCFFVLPTRIMAGCHRMSWLLCTCAWGSGEREMGNYPRELCTMPSRTSPHSKSSLHVLTPLGKGVRDIREVLQGTSIPQREAEHGTKRP